MKRQLLATAFALLFIISCGRQRSQSAFTTDPLFDDSADSGQQIRLPETLSDARGVAGSGQHGAPMYPPLPTQYNFGYGPSFDPFLLYALGLQNQNFSIGSPAETLVRLRFGDPTDPPGLGGKGLPNCYHWQFKITSNRTLTIHRKAPEGEGMINPSNSTPNMTITVDRKTRKANPRDGVIFSIAPAPVAENTITHCGSVWYLCSPPATDAKPTLKLEGKVKACGSNSFSKTISEDLSSYVVANQFLQYWRKDYGTKAAISARFLNWWF